MALASGETNYMAPASARQMASDLALLPMWYAEAGSAVLASSAYNADFLKTKSELLGMDVALLTEPEVAGGKDWKFSPWGWDPALRKRLMTLGADQTELPSADYMNILREHSHRLQAVKLLPGLRLNEYFCGESFYLSTLAECSAFVEGREACLLKAPLSGSGKGLNWCKGIFTTFISGWCARVAASQGGVVGEPIYNKVEDFAMEFRSSGNGRFGFAGYSQFRTGGSGAYEGNLLISDAAIEGLFLPDIRSSTRVGVGCMREMTCCLTRRFCRNYRLMCHKKNLSGCGLVWKKNCQLCSVAFIMDTWEWI